MDTPWQGGAMLETLMGRCVGFLDITVEGLKDWFRSRSLALQIGIIATGGCLLGGFAFKDTVIQQYAQTRALVRVAINTDSIPLPGEITGSLRPVIDELTRRLDGEIDDALINDTLSAWPLAQAIVATSGPQFARKRPQQVIGYIRNHAGRARPCACWSEFDRPSDPVVPVASAWVLWAYATMGEVPTASEIDYVLKAQRTDGAWPIFHLDDGNTSSTWATAIMAIGLHALIERNLIEPARRNAVILSVQRARGWLLSVRRTGHHLWTYHPSLQQSEPSESLSAMAIFALTRTNVAPITTHDDLVAARSWLDTGLAAAAPIGRQPERNYIEIRSARGEVLQYDHFAQIPAPWKLAAGVSLYPKVKVDERAKIFKFLEAQLAAAELGNATSIPATWERAELLVALNYALSKLGATRERTDS
jgi:hypothetical protein